MKIFKIKWYIFGPFQRFLCLLSIFWRIPKRCNEY